MRSVTSHGAPRDVGGEGEEELSRERDLSGGGPRGGRGAIGNCSLLAGVRGERTLGPSSGARPRCLRLRRAMALSAERSCRG